MNEGLLGAELKRVRLAAALTADQLARRSGLDAGVIEAIENGGEEPGIEELFKLCLALGVEADQVVRTVWEKQRR